MSVQRMIVFDPKDLYNLLLHYDEGKHLPLNAEVKDFGFSQFMQRWVGLEVESSEWPSEGWAPAAGAQKMVHVRYEGKKTLSWSGEGEGPQNWKDGVEAPKRQ